jgi:ABC-type glycerol-3-phosphate transport system permease component
MQQLPDELLEAARIDGCSEFRIFWEVALPLTRPMIGAFCLIAFMGSWNSFMWPPMILFFILQKEFISGLTAGAVKA